MKIRDLDYFNQITEELSLFGGRHHGRAFKFRRLAIRLFGKAPSIKFLTQAGINLKNGSPLLSVGVNSTGSTLTTTVGLANDGIQKSSFSSSSSSG